jgi:HlyD family secretion protein
VISSRSTEIRCTLERLDLNAQGQVGTQPPSQTQKEGASTIISLVPDGAAVKRGDMLCELDSSEYQELARRQQIIVEEARAAHSQASLALEVAKLTLRSYREGEKGQVVREYKGEIALARSDLARQADRVAWSRRMLGKGYASAAQVASDKQQELRLVEKLREMELTLENFERYTSPREARSLEADVLGAKATLDYQSSRLEQERRRLAHYQSMVERCTIRAPHDGYVVYANRPRREPEVYLGAPVRERMRLFYLPDPTKMEVEAMLHGTDVERIRPGMPAEVHVEAMPSRPMSGRIESVAQVPKSEETIGSVNQIAYYAGRVKLTSKPPGLRPGMTAEIRILSEKHAGVLTVPAIAVEQEDGREFCYVDRRDSLERRPVKVIRATHDLIEVVEGLTEGERVVLDPQIVNSKVLR